MTEEEWLVRTDPRAMLAFLLPARVSNRKARLFACASVRQRWWHWLADNRSRLAVEAGEQYADKVIDRKGMRKVARPAQEVTHALHQAGESGLLLEAAE